MGRSAGRPGGRAVEVTAGETRRDLERRQIVISRDLPQIEALARMDGYLPPAEIPAPENSAPE
jgi:hypothetical protein